MKFKLLRGSHSEGAVGFKANEIVTSDMDLESVFGSEKFQKVEGSCGSKGSCGSEEDCSEDIIEEQVAAISEAAPEGADVSSDFPNIKGYVYDGIQILKRKRKYFVLVDGEQVNPEPLAKKEVDSFVSDYFG
tara:strand:- start:114 stop:509 length:396 start_codon:yes stop_codon:yes gene_type:complete